MFRRKTLFVVGAGASREAELPVGVTLAQTIARILAVSTHNPDNEVRENLLKQLYEKYPLQNNGYHQAAIRICEGVRFANSIDDFLDHHSGDLNMQRVGKVAIVKTILDAEEKSLLCKDHRSAATIDNLEGTWYIKFFRMPGGGINKSNVGQIFENVAFVVFNYDRCVEHFLFNTLQLTYGVSEAEASKILKGLNIVHPYGVAGPLFAEASTIRAPSIPFGGMKGYFCDYVGLSESVKIFTEQIASGDLLKRVHDMMFWAEQIVFLGFGYHEPNLQILTPKSKMKLKPVLGTAVGMSASSIDKVRDQFATVFSGTLSAIRQATQIDDMSCAELFDYHIKTLPS